MSRVAHLPHCHKALTNLDLYYPGAGRTGCVHPASNTLIKEVPGELGAVVSFAEEEVNYALEEEEEM